MCCVLLWCSIMAAGDGRDSRDCCIPKGPVLGDCPPVRGTRFILAQRHVGKHHLSPLGFDPFLCSV